MTTQVLPCLPRIPAHQHLVLEFAVPLNDKSENFQKLRFGKLPQDIRINIIREFLSVPDTLSLRTTSSGNFKEQEDAYTTGQMKSFGFDSFVFKSVLAARWVILKKISLRSFTLKLSGLPVGITSLHWICEANEVDIANLMLAKGTQDVNELSCFPSSSADARAATPGTGAANTYITAFHTACRKGHVEIVKAFLRDPLRRTQVNSPDNNGVTPLMFASGAGHLEVVQALLAHPEIDINLSEYALGVNALYAAAIYSHAHIVSALLADRRVSVNQANVFGLVPLTAAVFSENVHVFESLVSDKRTDLNQETRSGDTPLNISAAKGFLPAVKMLLSCHSAQVNQANMHRKTPLFSAAANGHFAIVQALLQDDRVSINVPDLTNTTPYMIAIRNGHEDIAKSLLEDRRFEAVIPTPDALLLENE